MSRAISSDRRNSVTVCSGDRCGRLSNHFGTRNSALAPTALPSPSTSISTRTKACGVALMTTAPNRNGRAKVTGRSKKAKSFTAKRYDIKQLSVQRALGEKVLTNPLHQFGEGGIGHGVQRTWAR